MKKLLCVLLVVCLLVGCDDIPPQLTSESDADVEPTATHSVDAIVSEGSSEDVSFAGDSDTKSSSANLSPEVNVESESENKPYDVRKVRWGMTRDEVRRSEDELTLIQTESYLFCPDIDVARLNARLIYEFNSNDQLTMVIYDFNEIHANNNAYVDDYDNVKKQLIDKYGEPTKDIVNRDGSLWTAHEERGMAVLMEEAHYLTLWDLTNTQILMSLKGESYQINMYLSYKSKEYEKGDSAADDNGL